MSRCKQRSSIDIDQGYFCEICQYISYKQKHEIDEKLLRQNNIFSERLPCANEKIEELYFFMMNKNTKEDLINELQFLKGKTKLNFNSIINTYFDEMNYVRQSGNFHFQKVGSSKNAQDMAMNMHEAMLLMKGNHKLTMKF